MPFGCWAQQCSRAEHCSLQFPKILRSKSSLFSLMTRILTWLCGSFQKFYMTLFFILELISCCIGIHLKIKPNN
jgi:hypothetical protein